MNKTLHFQCLIAKIWPTMKEDLERVEGYVRPNTNIVRLSTLKRVK